jgi:hypothetical protein
MNRRSSMIRRTLSLIAVVAVLSALSSSALGYRFCVLGDRTGGHVEGVYPEIVEEMTRLAPDFIVTVGDLIEGYLDDADSTHEEWDEVIPVLDRTGIPYHVTPGNHDIWDDQSDEIYRDRVGPPYLSFDYENTHFVILDNSRIETWDDMEEEQYRWLVDDLEAASGAENIFVFFHKPFWAEALEEERGDRLHPVFLEYGVDRIFSGHWHHYFQTDWDGIPYIEVGSSGGGMWNESDDEGYFYHYLFVTVEGSEVDVAVMRKGSALPEDVVTLEDNFFFDEIRRDLVDLEGLRLREDEERPEGSLVMTVRSPEYADCEGTLNWDVEGTEWMVTPGTGDFGLGPNERVTLEFEADLRDPDALFPLPRLDMDYVSKGKTVKVATPILLEREATCVRTTESPMIDGDLSEDLWSRARPIRRFSGWSGDPSRVENTEVLFAHDGTNLYLAARCEESEPARMRSETTERDGTVYYDDNLWFFFDGNLDRKTYVQLMVNPLGAIFDRHCRMEGGKSIKDVTWDGTFDVAAKQDGEGWTLEIAVPLMELGGKSGSLGFNIRRTQYSTDDVCVYQIPFDHDPSAFALLNLE